MAVSVLLSPTEKDLRELYGDGAVTSSFPESKGADIVICTEFVWFYFQRKSVPDDFLISISDGRMARCTSLLSQQDGIKRMITEGQWLYNHDGSVYLGKNRGRYAIKSGWRRSHIEGMEMDIEYVKGIPLVRTADINDTYHYLQRVAEWASRPNHSGMYTRPSVKGQWIIPTKQELHLWILQSWPGIGIGTAEKILDHFGDNIPLAWTCSAGELAKVKGLSLKKAEELIATLSVIKKDNEDRLSKIREKLRGS